MNKYLIILALFLLPIGHVMSNDKFSLEQGFEVTVNINTASAEEIATLLQGVGSQKAQAIVDFREEHGDFLTKEQLIQVKGIGPAIVSRNKDRILL